MKLNTEYLVDTCKGTKYYKNLKNAIKQFTNNNEAHTIAQRHNKRQWIIIGQKNQSNIKFYKYGKDN